MKVSIIILTAALVLTSTTASAQFRQVDEQLEQQPGGGGGRLDDDGLGNLNPDDPEDLRLIVIAWAQAMEAAYGQPSTTSDKFISLSPEHMEYYAQIIGDRQAWALNLREVMASLREPLQGDIHANSIPSPVAATYPVNSGAYATLVADLFAGGYITSTSQRCDATKFAQAYNAWFIAHTAIGVAESACTIAGCDPTGVACAIACAITETARNVIDLATIPVRLCEFHDGNVQDAEIEAVYENTRRSFTGLQSLETQIDSAKTTIVNNDNSNRSTITTSLSATQTAIINNDDANKTSIINNDNTNRSSIIANGDANRTTIINNDNTNLASILSAGAGDLAAVITALANRTAEIKANDDTNAANILTQDMDSRNAVIGNDDANHAASLADAAANRAAVMANDDANRAAVMANDDANRATVMANDDANRDTILAAIAANHAALVALENELARASRVREIQHALGSAQCEPWMYLPASAPDGHLEEVITVVQSAIDASRTWGTASAHDLDMAQRSLDKVATALAAGAPMDAQRLCQDLRQAYAKATPAGQQ